MSLLKQILSLITMQSVSLRVLKIPLCGTSLCGFYIKFEKNFKLL